MVSTNLATADQEAVSQSMGHKKLPSHPNILES